MPRLYRNWLYESLEEIYYEDAEERDNDQWDRPAVQLWAVSTTWHDPAALTKGGFSFLKICAYLSKATAPASNDLKTSARRNHLGRSKQSLSLLLGAEWQQVICSEVPFEVLEKVQVAFLEVVGML